MPRGCGCGGRSRCAPAIQHLADVWAGAAALDTDIVEAGVGDGTPAILEVSEAKRLDTIRGVVEKLRSEGFAPEEIALLSLIGASRPEGLLRRRPDRLEAVAADDPEAATSVVLDTFLRFKGLERRAVILGDIQTARREVNYSTRVHIAASRANSVLRIVAVREAIEADPVLRALRAAARK